MNPLFSLTRFSNPTKPIFCLRQAPFDNSLDSASCLVEQKPGWIRSIWNWSGGENFSSAAYFGKKRQYSKSIEQLGIGVLKSAIIAGAAYGVYRWLKKDSISSYELLRQAELDSEKTTDSGLPASVRNLTDKLYAEHKQYSHFPKSAKDFFESHLNRDKPVSCAISAHFFKTAQHHGGSIFGAPAESDASAERMFFNICTKQEETSKACISVLDEAVGTKLESPTQETLDLEMSLLNRCRNNRNDFCVSLFDRAKTHSIELKSTATVLSLLNKASSWDMPENQRFVKAAIPILSNALETAKKDAHACGEAKGGNKEFEQHCLDLGGMFEKLTYFDNPKYYFNLKAAETDKKLQELIQSSGLIVAKTCHKLKDPTVCKEFVQSACQTSLDYGLAKEAFALSQQSDSGCQISYPRLMTAIFSSTDQAKKAAFFDQLYSWIGQKKLPDEALAVVAIDKLFEIGRSDSDSWAYHYGSCFKSQTTMARILATKFIEFKTGTAASGNKNLCYEYTPGIFERGYTSYSYANSVDENAWNAFKKQHGYSIPQGNFFTRLFG